MLEVYRTDVLNGFSTLEYSGFHRSTQDQTNDKNDVLFTSFGRGYVDLTHRREILYFAGTPGDSKFGPADDVMKAYVRENAGSLATTANGRLRGGVTTGLGVAPDNSLGIFWAGSAAWKNLLDLLQQVSLHGSIDFDVQRTGPLTFQFNTYYPRLGIDRTVGSITTFAPELGNMSLPFATTSRVEEANDVLVLGNGEGAARVFRETQDLLAQGASPWNRIERTHDSRDSTTLQQLDDVAQVQLNAWRATRHITFQVLQSRATAYGRDYRLGDLIVAKYKGIQEVKKIVGVEVTVANGREDIRVHFDDENAAIL